MKIFEYGHFFIVMAEGNQYIIDGNMGYKNAPWSKVSPNRVYIAKLDNGRITAADTVTADSTFSGSITKAEKWDPTLYSQIERHVMMEAIKSLLEVSPLKPTTIMMNSYDYSNLRGWRAP